jgi:hypothetical protein
MKEWLDLSGAGPLFPPINRARTRPRVATLGLAVAVISKRTAKEGGLAHGTTLPHSLSAGFLYGTLSPDALQHSGAYALFNVQTA